MKPLTRKEFFMAKAAGQTVPDIEPITREEYFLNQIAESGGGGGGGGGGGSRTLVDFLFDDEGNYDYLKMNCEDIYAAYFNGTVFAHASYTVEEISNETYMQIISVIKDSSDVYTGYNFYVVGRDGVLEFGGPEGEYPKHYL